MPNFRYEWKGEYVKFMTRHMPKVMHTRLKMEAVRRGESAEMILIRAVDYGLSWLEKQKLEG